MFTVVERSLQLPPKSLVDTTLPVALVPPTATRTPLPYTTAARSVLPVLVPALHALGPTSPAIVCVAELFAVLAIAINLAFGSSIVTLGTDVYPVPAVLNTIEPRP